MFAVLHNSTGTTITPKTTRILYGVFTAVTLVGVAVLACLRKPPSQFDLGKEEEEEHLGHLALLSKNPHSFTNLQLRPLNWP